ncbi:MAG: hypothetical protein HYV68_02880 [Candidatus Taylorbacteria bacterium]|nr:hypothetical protein [Candidatus Taylorbacteria bacterium]
MLEYPVPFINIEYVFYQIYQLVSGQFFGLGGLVEIIQTVSIAFFPYAVVLSLMFMVGITYCFIRIRDIEHGMIEEHEAGGPAVGVVDQPNKRWVRIVKHLDSENESDWRLAILEADLILEEMLDKMGYPGDTIADKLKGIEQSDFNTINDAWEGHRIRNLIAHEGGNFRITNREARRVVSLYEKVFKEFHFI